MFCIDIAYTCALLLIASDYWLNTPLKYLIIHIITFVLITDKLSIQKFIFDDYCTAVIALHIGVALSVQTESYISSSSNYFMFLFEG